jgi:hypothetical protein
MGGTCSTVGERLGSYRALVWRPDPKRPLGIGRRRWKNNIKKDSSES